MDPNMPYSSKVADETQLAGNIERADHFGNSDAAYNQIASEGTDSVLGYMDKKYKKNIIHSNTSATGGNASLAGGTPGLIKFATGVSANADVFIKTSIGRDISSNNTISVNQFKSDVYKDLRGISSDTTLSSSQRAVKMQKYLEGLGDSGASFANGKGSVLGVPYSTDMNLKGNSPVHNPANYNHNAAEEAEE